MSSKQIPQSCRRCGTCCDKGGPALHEEDMALVRDNSIALSDLFTIRRGEPVVSPLVDGVEPSRTELVKITGHHDSWTCRFFSREHNSCGIYDHRPLECRLLMCWQPSTLTKVIYQHVLTRQHLLPEDEELKSLMEIQEEHCSFAALARLAEGLHTENNSEAQQQRLTEVGRILTLDLRIRQRALQVRGLSLAEELLYFGRPMFKSLSFFRLTMQEEAQGGIRVSLAS